MSGPDSFLSNAASVLRNVTLTPEQRPLPQKELDKLLFVAIQRRSKSLVEKAMAEGANVNAKPKTRNTTPFMFAASFGLSEIVELLFERGADPTRKINGGRGITAENIARANGYYELARRIAQMCSDWPAKQALAELREVYPQTGAE